jgi:hypothetical protein
MENYNQGQLQEEEASTQAHFQVDPIPSPEDQVEETTEDTKDIDLEEDPEEEDEDAAEEDDLV